MTGCSAPPDPRRTNGFLARVEADTNRDGVIDKRETFVPRADRPDGRVLQMVELDLDQAGNRE